jgi:TolB-like protein/tetratricopeptide (TPR) repeat protein
VGDFFEQLKQRKLVQWALAYGAGAWVLLQFLGLMVDSYEWPHEVMRVAFVVVVCGFLITIVLAWYHGERGEQRLTRNELLLLTVLLILGGSLLWHTAHAPQPVQTPAVPMAAALAPIPTVEKDPSIAVLPLVNMSSDKEQDYFSDGISEELLNLLAKVPKLRVIARTSSFAFKGKEVDIQDIARKLNVAAILEGSVRKSGNTVRITVQLIRASDNSHLWSEDYDRTLDDIFKVQDEIAATVVAKLKISLLGAAPTVRPVDARAYPLILQAKFLSDQGTAASRVQAITLYQQALAIAPSEPRAWAGLARVYINQGAFGDRPAAEAYGLARKAAQQALASDPDNAVAHAYLGRIASAVDGDLVVAAQQIQQSLALDPSDPQVLNNAGLFLVGLGRLDQSIALDLYLVAHDQANASGHNNLGTYYYLAGRWDQAIASLRPALALSPGFSSAHETLGLALLFKGDIAGALLEMQAEADESIRLEGLVPVLHALGRKPESDAALATLIAKYGKDQAFFIATALAYRGEADRAFEWLDKASTNHDPYLYSISVEPLLNSLHKDPRWLPLLRKLGKAPEQLAKIEFKLTLPQ